MNILDLLIKTKCYHIRSYIFQSQRLTFKSLPFREKIMKFSNEAMRDILMFLEEKVVH